MEIKELNDEELQAEARAWRLRALRGEVAARSPAFELERELRQRARLKSSEPALQAAEVPAAPPPHT